MRIYISALFFMLFFCSYAQKEILDTTHSKAQSKISQLSCIPETETKIDISVNQTPITDLLQNIAKAGAINISIHQLEGITVTCNFKQIKIKDLLLFLYREYDINLDITGNIINLSPSKEKTTINAFYDEILKTISYDFTDVKLINVIKEISTKANCDITIPENLFDYKVSGFSNKALIEDAIKSFAITNSLQLKHTKKRQWYLFKATQDEVSNQFQNSYKLEVDSLDLITIQVNKVNTKTIISDIFSKLQRDHFITEEINRDVSLFLKKVSLPTLLNAIFSGTPYSWKIENGIYILGDTQANNDISITKIIPMQYRSVDKIQGLIPSLITSNENIEVKTFPDLNCLVTSGPQQKILKIENFVKEIDKSVPLISIDIMIVDATKKNIQDIGISAGIGKSPANTEGSISPGVGLSLSASSINNLINAFNGFGSINLGKVSPNFYMNLKLLEEDGRIILRSTPRLSTLNGHKATLLSGEKKYYKESQTNIIGTQNPLQSNSYTWKSVEANMELNIIPYVSTDKTITLEINITQSEFSPQKENLKDAPPGTYTRSFNSIIKVKDQEMVLLGGIEKEIDNNTSRGLPFIARIPILKWFFGSTSKHKVSQKLNIFVKPTIIE